MSIVTGGFGGGAVPSLGWGGYTGVVLQWPPFVQDLNDGGGELLDRICAPAELKTPTGGANLQRPGGGGGLLQRPTGACPLQKILDDDER